MKITNTLLTMLILVSSFLTPACQLDPAPRADLVIVGGTLIHAKLIDGAMTGSVGGEPIENAIIIIRDGRIVAAGPQSHIPFPKGGKTLDARGKRIVFGLIAGNGTQHLTADPETIWVMEGQPANLVIFENDPLGEEQSHPKIFKVIQAGKIIEPMSRPGQKQP